MLSLILIVAIFVLIVVVEGYAIARAARAVGSPRGRFLIGMLAMLLAITVNLGLLAAGNYTGEPDRPSPLGKEYGNQPPKPPSLTRMLAVAGAGLFAIYLLLSGIFALRGWRSLAPLGAYLGVGICFALLFYFVIYPYVLESYYFPTVSMSPTIEQGDRFYVNRLIKPQRWDLVAYKQIVPSPPGADAKEMEVVYCHRLVGLPGETIRIENGQLLVNGAQQTAPPIVAGRYKIPDTRYGPGPHYREGQDIQLGPNECFILGDNVERAGDSRFNGPVTMEKVTGVADMVYWPLGHARILR
jgi:signal peptidase I